MITPDLEKEQVLLGEILRSAKTALPQVVGNLTPEHFEHHEHQWIYNACLSLFRNNNPVDIVSVSEFLAQDGVLDQSGGRHYLNSLAVCGDICCRPEWYSEKIREAHVRREIGWLSENAAMVASGNPAEALKTIQDGINTLSGMLNPTKQTTTQDLIQQALEEIFREDQGEYRGPVTGFQEIDKKLKGLSPGELIIIAGRPSMGKSAFALNIASHIAIHQNRPVLFFSLEMEPVALMSRILKAEAETGYSSEKLLSVKIPHHYRILDTPNLDVMKLKGSILEHQAELGDIGLVIVDYLQLMVGEGDGLVEQVTRISKGLKATARETKVPIVALSQLSRKVEQRQDKRPIMSDLRESGALEQDADEAILLYRHEYYYPGENIGEVEANIGKNRDGETGVCKLYFRHGVTRFYDRRPTYAG